jgi:ABC-type Na+ efflux pump permease subunit
VVAVMVKQALVQQSKMNIKTKRKHHKITVTNKTSDDHEEENKKKNTFFAFLFFLSLFPFSFALFNLSNYSSSSVEEKNNN